MSECLKKEEEYILRWSQYDWNEKKQLTEKERIAENEGGFGEEEERKNMNKKWGKEDVESEGDGEEKAGDKKSGKQEMEKGKHSAGEEG